MMVFDMQDDSKDIVEELLQLQEYGVMNVSEHVAAGELLGRTIAEIQYLRGIIGVLKCATEKELDAT